MDFTAGRLRARLVPVAEAGAALDLRARIFRNGANDADGFDADAGHLMIDAGAAPIACARVTMQDASSIGAGYSAQHYDLTGFAARFPRALEVGRVCFAQDAGEPEAPRLLLAMLARLVMTEDVAVLYGCSSFPACGTGMARLARHMAPDVWKPRPKSTRRCPLPMMPGQLPPLLRSYLALGASVSDHAVADPDLDTLHVFTALPIAAIPPARARLLTGLIDAA